MHRAIVASVLTALVLAGCSAGEGQPPAAEETSFEDLGPLTPTADTGILRGIVIDEGIHPLAGVAINITGAGVATATTNDDGAFGLDGLAPGDYFMTASKPGYVPVQASGTVVAGLANPDPVKIVLLADPASLPYPAQYFLEGYLTCSARVMLTAYPAGECMENDNSQVTYELDRIPDWAQSEMVWESTQSLGDAMSLVSECFSETASDPDPCPDGNLVVNRSEGSSPLIIKMDNALLTTFRYGDGDTGNPYRLRVFAAGREDTDVIDEESNNEMLNSTSGGAYPCVAWPAINEGCFRFTGAGVITNQQFKVYTTVFYGYVPPADWLFIETSTVPDPPK